jgi:putative transposase
MDQRKGSKGMSRKRHTAEQIVTKLREIEVLQGKGQSILEACRQAEISEQTYYKWRKEFGGLQVDQAKRYKQLEQENSQLRKLVADLSMDISILKEANKKNW